MKTESKPVYLKLRDEIAAAILWLLSDEASYTSGALLDVSGAR